MPECPSAGEQLSALRARYAGVRHSLPDQAAVAPNQFYVSCSHGSDLNPGTSASLPVKTLARAQALTRKVHDQKKKTKKEKKKKNREKTQKKFSSSSRRISKFPLLPFYLSPTIFFSPFFFC